jgi:hypothetical protein
MRLGLVLPFSPALPGRPAVAVVQAAERLGYACIWAADVGGWDPFVLLARMTGATERIELAIASSSEDRSGTVRYARGRRHHGSRPVRPPGPSRAPDHLPTDAAVNTRVVGSEILPNLRGFPDDSRAYQRFAPE